MSKAGKTRRYEARPFEHIPADAIILGFTGFLGSGCSYISKGFRELSHDTWLRFKMADVIRESLADKGIKSPTVVQMQDEGDRLRHRSDGKLIAYRTLDAINDDPCIQTRADAKKECIILVDGLKNDAEVRVFRQFANFFLIAVHASDERRCARLIDDETIKNGEEFAVIRERELQGDDPLGQQVEKCNYLADIIVTNEEDIAKKNDAARKEFLGGLVRMYVDLIVKRCFGQPSYDRPPTVDEMMMTVAYCASRSSSCKKRQVGAVIAKVEKPEGHEQARPHEKDGIQRATIVSSGYNEVPPGAKPCVLDTRYEGCYRDWLQEKGAAQVKNCPTCGKPVAYPKECPSGSCGKPLERHVKYCPACGKDVFSSVVCGCGTKPLLEGPLFGKHTSSKMMDVCRSLHAEETAILNMAKEGIAPQEEFVLYTTTYPCPLCANKIAALQIKRVVYAEVYTMPEAQEILESAGVTVDRFTGVKSTAYFKLYGR